MGPIARDSRQGLATNQPSGPAMDSQHIHRCSQVTTREPTLFGGSLFSSPMRSDQEHSPRA